MPRSGVLAALIFLLACDPTKVSDDVVGKAASKVGEVKEAEAKQKGAAAKKKQDEFRGCMAACAGADSTEPTDRATCRLQCTQKIGDEEPRVPSSTQEAVLRGFDVCEAKCGGEASAPDAATCRFNCTQTAAASAAPPGVAAESTVRGCSSACLEGLVLCTGKCPGQGNDGSTCSLHCESDVKRCLTRCGTSR